MISKFIKYFLLIFLISFGSSMPEGRLKNGQNNYSFWNLRSFSGLISLDAHYRSGTINLPGYFSDTHKSTFFSGELNLNTSSFVIHPNFFKLDANFGFRPQRNLDLYIVSPDNSEINTVEKADLNGIFFNERIFSINPYFNFNHAFNKREYSSNIETFYTNYGTRLSSPNKILPANVNISQNDWKQNEIQTDRKFSTKQFSVNTEIRKSFKDFSNNSFNVDYFDFKRSYTPNSAIHNRYFAWQLNNNFLLNRSRNFNFNSRVLLTNQKGSQPLNRIIAAENLYSDLPANFRIYLRYQFNRLIQDSFRSKQHDAEIRADHRLFQSLNSHIFYNYVTISQSFYDENIHRTGIGFDYRKIIPTGVLRLNYDFTFNKEKRDNTSGYIYVVDEEHVLTDGLVVLLDNPFTDMNSVVIKDITGTIIYQENLDYILIKRGSYIEIQRVIGGQISNGTTVLISYRAEQQPSLSFNTNINRYGAGLTVLNNLIDIYFSATDQNYNNTELTNSQYLKTLNQKLYGGRITYEWLEAGTEYEDYKSNITPYTSLRYYLKIYGQLSSRIIATLNGSYRTYHILDDNSTQKFSDVNFILGYLLSTKSKISFEGNYVVQNGKQIDLNLINFKAEYLTTYRQIDLSIGYQMYNRKLLGDRINYSGAFLKVSRRF